MPDGRLENLRIARVADNLCSGHGIVPLHFVDLVVDLKRSVEGWKRGVL